MAQATSMGLTEMRFGNGLKGPIGIIKGWSWSVYEQNENKQTESKTATATSGRVASGGGHKRQVAGAVPRSRPQFKRTQ